MADPVDPIPLAIPKSDSDRATAALDREPASNDTNIYSSGPETVAKRSKIIDGITSNSISGQISGVIGAINQVLLETEKRREAERNSFMQTVLSLEYQIQFLEEEIERDIEARNQIQEEINQKLEEVLKLERIQLLEKSAYEAAKAIPENQRNETQKKLVKDHEERQKIIDDQRNEIESKKQQRDQIDNGIDEKSKKIIDLKSQVEKATGITQKSTANFNQIDASKLSNAGESGAQIVGLDVANKALANSTLVNLGYANGSPLNGEQYVSKDSNGSYFIQTTNGRVNIVDEQNIAKIKTMEDNGSLKFADANRVEDYYTSKNSYSAELNNDPKQDLKDAQDLLKKMQETQDFAQEQYDLLQEDLNNAAYFDGYEEDFNELKKELDTLKKSIQDLDKNIDRQNIYIQYYEEKVAEADKIKGLNNKLLEGDIDLTEYVMGMPQKLRDLRNELFPKDSIVAAVLGFGEKYGFTADDIKAIQDELKKAREDLAKEETKLAEISKLDAETQNAVEQFNDATRGDVLGKSPQVITDAKGNQVYNEDDQYYRIEKDAATGEAKRVAYTDPLEIAQIKHQAWVERKAYANETHQSQDQDNKPENSLNKKVDAEALKSGCVDGQCTLEANIYNKQQKIDEIKAKLEEKENKTEQASEKTAVTETGEDQKQDAPAPKPDEAQILIDANAGKIYELVMKEMNGSIDEVKLKEVAQQYGIPETHLDNLKQKLTGMNPNISFQKQEPAAPGIPQIFGGSGFRTLIAPMAANLPVIALVPLCFAATQDEQAPKTAENVKTAFNRSAPDFAPKDLTPGPQFNPALNPLV